MAETGTFDAIGEKSSWRSYKKGEKLSATITFGENQTGTVKLMASKNPLSEMGQVIATVTDVTTTVTHTNEFSPIWYCLLCTDLGKTVEGVVEDQATYSIEATGFADTILIPNNGLYSLEVSSGALQIREAP